MAFWIMTMCSFAGAYKRFGKSFKLVG